MKTLIGLGLGAALSIGVVTSASAAAPYVAAARPAADSDVEVIVVTAKRPAPEPIDELVVTAKRPAQADTVRTPPAMPLEAPRLELALPPADGPYQRPVIEDAKDAATPAEQGLASSFQRVGSRWK